MLEWTPHLTALLGDSAQSQTKISQALILADALKEQRLRIPERLRVLEMVGDLDSMRQVFLAADVLESVGSPSRAIRRRVLALTEPLAAGKEKALRGALYRVFRRRKPDSKHLRGLLERIGHSVKELTTPDLDASFEELLRVRPHVFVLSSLLAVTRWVQRSKDARILNDFESCILSDEVLVEHLVDWVKRGNLLIRFLLVEWMAVSNESLVDDQPDARLALRQMYSADLDPVVAGAAIEQYARLTTQEEISSGVEFLTHELTTFAVRRLRFSGASDACRGIPARQQPDDRGGDYRLLASELGAGGHGPLTPAGDPPVGEAAPRTQSRSTSEAGTIHQGGESGDLQSRHVSARRGGTRAYRAKAGSEVGSGRLP